MSGQEKAGGGTHRALHKRQSMADVEFDDFGGGYATGKAGRFGRVVNLAGAVCSVALIAGLGVWGYKLAVRDVTGIPVIRALEGPLRIAPEDPGGEVADNQGLSVNAVAAAGSALPLPEKLVLAPRPVELAADDAAGLIDPDAPVATAEPADLGMEPTALPEVVANDAAPQTEADAVALALADALADGAEPLTPLEGDATALAAVDVAADTGNGLAKSPRPMARPRSLPAEATQPAAVSVAAPAEIDPTTIAAGTRLVQLGAFDDAETARAEWAKLQGQFGDLISGKAMVVQSAQSGGRTFYRLRAHGFADEDEARRFCAALLAENAACIPVAHR
jgi:cell division septation protein DedD